MNPSASDDSSTETSEPVSTLHERPISPDAAAHSDPLTGEPDAHPVGVGVGALSAGAAGAAVGAFLGPIGALVGAAIGAVAGGLAGKEVASGSESVESTGEGLAPVSSEPASADESFTDGRPLPMATSGQSLGTTSADEPFAEGHPLPMASSGQTLEPVSAEEPFADGRPLPMASSSLATTADEPADDGRPLPMASPGGPASSDEPFADDHPLPTASSGLITPDESSFFADSTEGRSEMLVESPLPAMFAVSADPDPDSETSGITESPVYTSHLDTEHTIRVGAYYRYLDREETHQPGDALGDWVAAEHEVLHPR